MQLAQNSFRRSSTFIIRRLEGIKSCVLVISQLILNKERQFHSMPRDRSLQVKLCEFSIRYSKGTKTG